MKFTAEFSGARLREAREARGFFQTEIARRLDVSPAAVSQWEQGRATPSADHRRMLADELGVREDFFFWQPEAAIEGPTFFRSLAAATKRERVVAKRESEWISQLVQDIEERVELPELVFPPSPESGWKTLNEKDIEVQADRIRELWGLGRGPISNLVWLLEKMGIAVVRLPVESDRLDAHSWWTTFGRPIIWLGSNKASGVRSRFDAAHELGHLVLHRNVDPSEFHTSGVLRELEHQANRFASAFLMPAESFTKELRDPSLEWLRMMKPRWKVSIAAMIRRIQDLELAPERRVTSLWKGRSAKGWTKQEPGDDDIPPETPRLLSSAFKLLVEHGSASITELRELVPLPESEVERLAGLEHGFFRGRSGDVLPIRPKRRTAEAKNQEGRPAKTIRFPGQSGGD